MSCARRSTPSSASPSCCPSRTSGSCRRTEVADYANLIHDAAGHLLAVINNILDISKMQSGKAVMDPREVDLGEVLSASASSFRLMAENAGVLLEEHIDPDLPRDQRRWRAPAPGVHQPHLQRAQVHAQRRLGGRHRRGAAPTASLVSVRDTGVGMTAEEIAVALTPFGQVDASHARWREGTGLGLPIASALVQLHGGELKISSQKGKGTVGGGELPVHQRRRARMMPRTRSPHRERHGRHAVDHARRYARPPARATNRSAASCR